MSNIIDKLRKLLSHADSARAIGNQAEAEAFAAKAAQLQDQHKIDESQLEITEDAGEMIDVHDFDLGDIYGTRTAVTWKSVLSKALSEAYYCKGIMIQKYYRGPKVLRVYGKPSDRALFLYTFQTISEVIDRLSKNVGGARYERNAWRVGFAVGVATKLKAERLERERASNPHAIVLVDARKAVEDVMNAANPRQTQSKASVNPAGYKAYDAGVQAGKAHGLQRAVGGTGSIGLRLGSGS